MAQSDRSDLPAPEDPWAGVLGLDSQGKQIPFGVTVGGTAIPNGNMNLGATSANWYMVPVETQNTQNIKITSFHVSCRSSPFDQRKNYIGFVIYLFDGKTDWTLNGVHCKSGYIYIVDASLLDQEAVGTMHAKAYYRLFNVQPQRELLVASGFAFQNGEWKETSSTFNMIPGVYKKQLERTGLSEINYVKGAINNWTNGGGRN